MPRHQKRVLVVGAGSIGERHLRCFLSTGQVRVAFVEPRADLRTALAERYPDVQPFDTIAAALENAFDAAVVATPAPLHVPQSIELAERGIHLLIEKPLCVDGTGLERLVDIVNQRRLIAAVAYVYRAHPSLAEMRKAIIDGCFGAPVELVAVCGQHFPLYRPAFRETYYASRASGGGALQDALTHLLDAAHWIVGPVDRVVADADRQILTGVEVEDTVHLLARHGRVLASYALNQHQAPNEVSITVVCERGTARFEMHSGRWRFMTEPAGEWVERGTPPADRDALFVRQAESFLEALDSTSDPLCPLADGIDAWRASRAALRSLERREWVTLEQPSGRGGNNAID